MAHYLFGDASIIRRAADHSPPPKLREPPDGIFRLGIIAVPLAVDHVIVILFLAAIAEVIIAEQSSENDLFWAVDISRARNNLGLFGAIVQVIEPDARFMQRF